MTIPRLSLCCMTKDVPIKNKTTTISIIKKKSREEAIQYLSKIVLNNCQNVLKFLKYCNSQNIKSFRVSSDLMPCKTHPTEGYKVTDLPDSEEIIKALQEAGKYAKDNNIRMSCHPDQFVILNALDTKIVEKSIIELEYHAEVAEYLNIDVMNIHGGGVYGDKQAALERLEKVIMSLPDRIKSRLTLENCDRSFTPSDLYEVCCVTGVPLVYDVHHHRCLPDGQSIQEATEMALTTWGKREPLFHISSPRDGWDSKNPRPHHDYIFETDYPTEWHNLKIPFTLDVEAKHKELAVLRLQKHLLQY